MNTTVFSENLRRFRQHKGLTQEQAASALGVNAQTVSRWECGTTLPDVMMLPDIARLYDATVDDFYKKNSPVYSNYADRLSSVYEMTRDPEDFMRCRTEYLKLMKDGELSLKDKWNYAIIHHFMFDLCRDTAMEWYNKVMADDPEKDPHVYYRSLACRAGLLCDLGREQESVEEQKERVKRMPDNPREWAELVSALDDSNSVEAMECFEQSLERFPNYWLLYIHGGYIYQKLGNDEEALACWDKAGELGTDFHDELYCKAHHYAKRGNYEKSYEIYMEIASKLREEGYDVEADMAEREADRVKAKIK